MDTNPFQEAAVGCAHVDEVPGRVFNDMIEKSNMVVGVQGDKRKVRGLQRGQRSSLYVWQHMTWARKRRLSELVVVFICRSYLCVIFHCCR